MNIANDDGFNQHFYDALLDHARLSVKFGTEIPQMLVIVNASGMARTLEPEGLRDEECLALSKELVAHPLVRAVAYVAESWVALSQNNAEHGLVTKLRNEHRQYKQPDCKEAVVINLMTANRQAQMICMIDRSNKSISKAPLLWQDGSLN